ncbi:MAG: Rid family hydrolase [Lentisphaeria bacterium]|nr:Rid family hydrolase [Lentisphaeria bacterium]
MDIRHAMFSAPGGIGEHFFSVSGAAGKDFETEAAAALDAYGRALAEYGCSPATEQLLRVHLSDAANQELQLRRMLSGRPGFLSVVGQAPLCGRLALEAWHWDRKPAHCAAYWFQCGQLRASGSQAQTEEEFAALKAFLSARNGSVAEHTLRTWLYCRDVDNNYAGLVAGRNRFFAADGLTPETHFIASTGIGGETAEPSRLVKMDSLNIFGLRPGQTEFLSAPEMLSPTTMYGVTFERGTRVRFGDRSWYFISGTASIDRYGHVVHPGDVAAQTGRMLDNVAALLDSGGAALSDVCWATLYLRDLADAGTAGAIVRARLGGELPLVILRAPVCRPAWLVEMECVAVSASGDRRFAPFC